MQFGIRFGLFGSQSGTVGMGNKFLDLIGGPGLSDMLSGYDGLGPFVGGGSDCNGGPGGCAESQSNAWSVGFGDSDELASSGARVGEPPVGWVAGVLRAVCCACWLHSYATCDLSPEGRGSASLAPPPPHPPSLCRHPQPRLLRRRTAASLARRELARWGQGCRS